MRTSFKTKADAYWALVELTGALFVCTFDPITPNEFIGYGFKSLNHYRFGDWQCTFAMIYSFDKDLNRVWVLHFGDI